MVLTKGVLLLPLHEDARGCKDRGKRDCVCSQPRLLENEPHNQSDLETHIISPNISNMYRTSWNQSDFYIHHPFST